MNEEIIDQLARYNRGFLDARIDVIGAFKLNKPIKLKEESLNQIKDVWYGYGFRDGFSHYSELINQHNDSYMTEDINKVMKISFKDRVLKMI